MTHPRTARSLAAEAAFRARLEELGATLLEPAWLGSKAKHKAICSVGHPCTPTPNYVQRGNGICRVCVGHDTATAEIAFRERLAELGAKPLYEIWLGGHVPHHVHCHAGHDCYPRPANAQRWGICQVCVGRDPHTGQTAFRSRLAELGAELLESEWLGALRKHRVRCGAGHECYVKPNQVQQGYGICKTCVGHDPVAAETAFRLRVAELGATLLEPEWLGANKPHLVRCPQGHLCRPTPGNVSQGVGVCRTCRGGVPDVFYVVTGEPGVKFGVTTGDSRHRLSRHAFYGYTEIVRLMAALPGNAALDTENAVKAALALAGEKPSRGREYFPPHCLALILDVADSWLGATAEIASPEIVREWVQDVLFAA